MHTSSVRKALASAFQIPTRPSLLPSSRNVCAAASRAPAATIFNPHSSTNARAPFSTTSAQQAKKSKHVKPDKRITLIRYFLHHPTTLMPRPLRFSRNRYLRHWTIHRAWNLFRASRDRSRQLELERQYNAMRDANEELRIGVGDGGKLFRKAAMKTGVWSIPERGGGVPIEYARGMVEYVGTKGLMGGEAKIWDSEWKRQ